MSLLTDAVFAVNSEEVPRTTAALVTSDDVRTLVFTAAIVNSALVRVCYYTVTWIIRWRRGVVVNALVVINEVTLRRARLVLGWIMGDRLPTGKPSRHVPAATQVNSAWPSLRG